MNEKKSNRTKIFWGIIILALLAVGGYFFTRTSPSVPASVPTSNTPTGVVEGASTVSIYGEYVCLPHKGALGPVTQECAFGLLADSDGMYYGLDLSDISSAVRAQLTKGEKITVEGMFTPISSGSIQTYNIIGTIRVSNIIFGSLGGKG